MQETHTTVLDCFITPNTKRSVVLRVHARVKYNHRADGEINEKSFLTHLFSLRGKIKCQEGDP